ncbi:MULTISPECIES: hypothetical protein [Pseudoalteromonas]|uniref:hypothetical protein n=1 Tax=Pseudoalteromonas TaxID=53246 RepID=UPI0002CBC475|nr:MULTISPECIES: hypothetical protein [Pseudoalteromonas]ENN99795.1 hypothetical protein J139_04300 [Pseudoalteromonas agarivorans S816]TMS64740.1 hypothetical protein CWB83_15735 [Pseudoalteromonas sp. S1691]TMS72410.1 hypothetical protein CWB86_01870 [Pseudoalteromonas sp. S1731]TMS73467.1 hypothetical protein CWB88_11835 [Pseudoalteromonas sp. S1941]TMS76376.1 hypothetical protein CWB82_17155 [Pseudoalteromonas sp. S1690]
MTTDTLKKVDIEIAAKKLKNEFGVTSERALSLAMGLSQSAFLNAMNRGTLPYEGIVKSCVERGISLDSIFGLKPKAIGTNQLNEPTPKFIHSEEFKNEVIHIDTLVESILDEVVIKNDLPVERLLAVRKSLRPILVDAAIEYDCDHAIVNAIARSSLKLV